MTLSPQTRSQLLEPSRLRATNPGPTGSGMKTGRITEMTKMGRFIEGAAILAAGLWLSNAAALPAQAQGTEEVYKKSCGSCHGPEGKGDGPAGKFLKPQPGDFSTVLKGAADADIAKIIKEGGKAVGKATSMPAFGSKLSEEQIQALVGYIKDLAAE